MFNKNIKIILAIGILSYSVYEFTEGYIGAGIMWILLASIFIFLYFKNEMILLAFFQLRKQNFEGANKWLGKIKNPRSSLTIKHLVANLLIMLELEEALDAFHEARVVHLSRVWVAMCRVMTSSDCRHGGCMQLCVERSQGGDA